MTNTLVVKGAYGIVWIKSKDGTWEQYNEGRQTIKEYLMLLAHEAAGSSNSGASGSSIAVFVGIVIGSIAGTVLVGALIALMVFEICKVKSKRILRRNNDTSSSATYFAVNDETDSVAYTHGSADNDSNV